MDDIITDESDIFTDSSSYIFKDEYILSIEYIPDKLIGRSEQVQKIADLINPLFRKGKPYSCLIYGKTGCGKTVVVKFVLNALAKKVLQKDFDFNLKWIYIPCKQMNTVNEILYFLITEIDPKANISRKGHPLNAYYTLLWEEITQNNLSLIIVLDEIDQLKKDDILYNLSRAGELKNIPDRRFITIFGISNDLNYVDRIDPRVKSSSSFIDIIFEPYDSLQIKSILDDRVKLAFHPNVVPDELVSICAARSAKSEGDARKAIDLLRTAGSIAAKEESPEITIDHLDRADEMLSENRYLKLAADLPLHNKLILLSVIKLARLMSSERTTSAVIGTYLEICNYQNPKIEPLRRTTISGIIGELEMLGFLKLKKLNRGRGGGVTRQIDIADKVPIELLTDVLYTDYNVDGLQEFVPKIYLFS
ncbi:MAG TPA: AAA family ATPase [Methanosarcina sp.]